jgi:hypothetical protein
MGKQGRGNLSGLRWEKESLLTMCDGKAEKDVVSIQMLSSVRTCQLILGLLVIVVVRAARDVHHPLACFFERASRPCSYALPDGI